MRFGVGLLQEIELELGAEHRREAEHRRAVDLALQDLPRRRGYRRPVVPDDVAEDERGCFQPGCTAKRRHVRHEPEVPVAAFPARDLVAGLRVHLHVEGEQVVAALDAVLGHVRLEEELPHQALAHQAALHVGERDDHRVDRTVLDGAFQLVQRQHRASPSAVRAVSLCRLCATASGSHP
jgi:hypothetical protein